MASHTSPIAWHLHHATLDAVCAREACVVEIATVERIPVEAGHVARAGKYMRQGASQAGAVGDWSIVEVCKVVSTQGLVGWGETIPHYTWGAVSDASVERVIGRNPAELMWDDSLGAGLQMALFDLVGKQLGVPVHHLIGSPAPRSRPGPQAAIARVRDWCPIAWWCWDMTPDDWVLETRDAVASGYTSFKFKARPWYDLRAAIEAISAATPDHCTFDLDFNGTLVSVAQAQRVLTELEKFPKVHFFETPIPQDHVDANRSLRGKLRSPIAMHFDNPPFLTAIQEGVCDGWVLNQGAARTVHQAALADEANMPFWLQLVGTGITTAFAAHLGAVLPQARWPAITCLNTYQDDLIEDPLEIRRGYVRVPQLPGLGVAIDEAALQRLRRPDTVRHESPRMIHTVGWSDGYSVAYVDHSLMVEDFVAGNRPMFEPGVLLTTEEDDGSESFADRWKTVSEAMVLAG